MSTTSKPKSQLTALALIAHEGDKEIRIGFDPVKSKTGRVTKFVAPLAPVDDPRMGSGSAADLKAFYRSQGIKHGLTKLVNEALRTKKTVRMAAMQLALSAATEQGFVGSHMSMNTKGNKLSLELQLAPEPTVAESTKLKRAKEEVSLLAIENQNMREQLAKVRAENEEKMAKMMAALEAAGITL